MLSRKIDLTENGDFGRENLFDDTLIIARVDDELVSCEEYAGMVRYEQVFGKTRHSNEKRKLFGYKSSSISPRGEDDIIPWKYVEIRKRIPWKRSNFMPNRIEEGVRNMFDLFALR